MKKKSANFKCVNFLYVLYFVTILHLAYFIVQDISSLGVFCFVSIFVYLVIPNQEIVLLCSIIFVDTLKLINVQGWYEGFGGSFIMDDLYDYGKIDTMNEWNEMIEPSYKSGGIPSVTSPDLNISKKTYPKKTHKDFSYNLWRKNSLADKYGTLPPVDSSLYDYNKVYNIPKVTVPYSTEINVKMTHKPTLYSNM
jgi:hypothetical protein